MFSFIFKTEFTYYNACYIPPNAERFRSWFRVSPWPTSCYLGVGFDNKHNFHILQLAYTASLPICGESVIVESIQAYLPVLERQIVQNPKTLISTTFCNEPTLSY